MLGVVLKTLAVSADSSFLLLYLPVNRCPQEVSKPQAKTLSEEPAAINEVDREIMKGIGVSQTLTKMPRLLIHNLSHKTSPNSSPLGSSLVIALVHLWVLRLDLSLSQHNQVSSSPALHPRESS